MGLDCLGPCRQRAVFRNRLPVINYMVARPPVRVPAPSALVTEMRAPLARVNKLDVGASCHFRHYVLIPLQAFWHVLTIGGQNFSVTVFLRISGVAQN